MSVCRTILLIFAFVVTSTASARPVRHPVRLSPEDRQILKDGEMSTSRYVISGVLGTYPGFGIGHAIQGRWLERGWIFTGGEMVTGVIGLVGAFGCHEPPHTSQSDSACYWPYAFLAAFTALKVWEIVDVWYEPYAHDQRYRELRHKLHRASRLRAVITPTNSGAFLALQYQFD